MDKSELRRRHSSRDAVDKEEKTGDHAEDDEEEPDIEDLVSSILSRKEVSVAWKDTSVPHLIVYGSLLYFVEQLLVYPSDLLKTRLQVDLRLNNKVWKDWLVLCEHIRAKEGYKGFFRGFTFNTVAGVPAQIVYLATYNWCKEWVEGLGGPAWKASPMAPLCAGALAEGLTSVVWVPLDVVVQKIQLQGGLPDQWESKAKSRNKFAVHIGGPFRSPWQVTQDVIKEDGVRGLWRGFGAHLIAFCPQAAIWWASYEQSKAFLAHRAPDAWRGTPVHLAAGVSAGVINAVVTNPLDTMKVRVQCKVGAGKTAMETITRMVQTEGANSLWKGLAPKIWMAVPVSALSSVCYELIMSLSKKRPPPAPSERKPS